MSDTQFVTIAASVVLEGVPANYLVMPYTASAYVRFADGKYVVGKQSFPQTVERTPDAPQHPSLRWRSVGYDIPLLRPDVRWESWPVVLEARAGDLKPRVGQTGAYVGTFRYTLVRVDETELPVREGATFRERTNSVEVLRAASQPDGCHLRLRMLHNNLAAIGTAPPVLSYRVVDRAGHAVHAPTTRVGGIPDPRIMRLPPWGGSSYPLGVDFIETTVSPACTELHLIVERTQRAGELARTLSLPHFQVR